MVLDPGRQGIRPGRSPPSGRPWPPRRYSKYILSGQSGMWGWLTGRRLKLSPDYELAARKFSSSELATLQSVYRRKAADNEGLADANLLDLAGLSTLPPSLAKRLTRTCKTSEGQLGEETFIRFLAEFKGMNFEPLMADGYVLTTLGIGGEGTVSQGQLSQILDDLICWASASSSAAALSTALATGAMQQCATTASAKVAEHEPELTRKELCNWLLLMPKITKALEAFLLGIVPAVLNGQTQPSRLGVSCQLPQHILPKMPLRSTQLSDCILTRDMLWLLSSWLPPESNTAWELLFNSNLHGGSYSTFMGKVCNKGPTIVLIRDKRGALFGGFAKDAWARNGRFYGASDCFVFSLLPAVTVWHHTGVNTNFQWCGQNFDALPNGIGFGGQVGFYAVAIDSTFDQGMSRPSATFGNPCLASGQVFEVDAVEVWLTQQPEQDALGKVQGSALDRFKEDRNLLELAGKTVQASRGYREAPPEE